MTQPKPPAEQWSPETDPDVIARRRLTAREYGQWVATEDIYHGTALAYRKGDPVPAANVELHGYDRAGLVDRVAEAADFDADPAATGSAPKAATVKGK